MPFDPRPALTETAEGVRLRLRVQPRAKKSGWAGLLGDALKLRIQAPPVDGKANAEVLRFVAEALGLPSRQVELTAGQTGRSKTVLARGVALAEVCAALGGTPPPEPGQ